MKRILWCLIVFLGIGGLAMAQDNGGYYMGPGMMWGNGYDDNGGYYCGNAMYGNWDNNDWHRNTQSSLNLTQQQSNQWNNVRTQSQPSQQAINDSINYYVRQVQRLQKAKSNLVQSDLNRIKGILTPQQYTEFLEKLVGGQ